jgi:hypothetical protein
MEKPKKKTKKQEVKAEPLANESAQGLQLEAYTLLGKLVIELKENGKLLSKTSVNIKDLK